MRIHVERVIGLLRNKYTILQGSLTTDFLMSSQVQHKVAACDVCTSFSLEEEEQVVGPTGLEVVNFTACDTLQLLHIHVV